jgi:hypothetical protein
MRWFRSKSGRVAWLAYFALACQLVLTFGHVHLASTGVVASAIAITTDTAADSMATPSSPAKKAPAGLARDICAVCNSVSLANTLVLPLLAVIVPPASFVQELRWSSEAIPLAQRHHPYFSARAPPHA